MVSTKKLCKGDYSHGYCITIRGFGKRLTPSHLSPELQKLWRLFQKTIAMSLQIIKKLYVTGLCRGYGTAIGMGILPLALISFPMWIGNSFDNKSIERLNFFGVNTSKMFVGDVLAHFILAMISMAIKYFSCLFVLETKISVHRSFSFFYYIIFYSYCYSYDYWWHICLCI